MKNRLRPTMATLGGLLCALVATAQPPTPSSTATSSSLVGIWTLTAADNLLPDGSRVRAYGPNPQGILVFGADGRYTLQIFRADRLKFASGDKRRGTFDEYKDVSLGMSGHFGHYTVDTVKGTITFQIERASYPNWDGATQIRPFTLAGDELSWQVPATPDGKIPISAWRRAR